MKAKITKKAVKKRRGTRSEKIRDAETELELKLAREAAKRNNVVIRGGN